MYKATVNESETFQITFAGDMPLVNDQPFDWNMVKLSDRTFHLLHNNQSFTAELVAIDASEKSVSLKINQHIHQIVLKDRFDLLLDQMGMSQTANTKLNDLKAPMPGMIVSVNVHPGDLVKKGDSVLILEAMKMENIIKAPGEGTVKTIRINKGDRVEKNQILIEFN